MFLVVGWSTYISNDVFELVSLFSGEPEVLGVKVYQVGRTVQFLDQVITVGKPEKLNNIWEW
jgi:hypothetical protein